jgi:release factor glutamine methyltransferase
MGPDPPSVSVKVWGVPPPTGRNEVLRFRVDRVSGLPLKTSRSAHARAPALRKAVQRMDASVVALGTRILARAGVETPREDAEALVAHASAKDEAVKLFRRRATREPLAYIIGTVSFCGLELMVDRRVLVPTEHRTGTLVRAAMNLPQRARVHEVGTGSGAVALAVKRRRPDLAVSGSDISGPAIDVARENARRLRLGVSFFPADGLPRGDFDLVLANLPYTDSAQVTQQLPPEEVVFQPGVALWAGADSLGLIRQLIGQTQRGTLLALEHAPHHTAELHRLLDEPQSLRDELGDERVTVGRAQAAPAGIGGHGCTGR